MANRFFSYAGGVKGSLSPFAKSVLMDLMNECGIDWLQITSVERTPEDQARIMFENCDKKGAASQHALYGPYGDQVIDIYETYTLMQYSKEAIIQSMAKKIRELGPEKVSHHCDDDPKRDVFDIGPHSLRSDAGIKTDVLRKSFEEAVKKDSRVVRFFAPSNQDPAFHLEVVSPATATA
jgi:hypothetical protein